MVTHDLSWLARGGRLRWSGLFAAALALVLVACGEDATSPSPTDTPTTGAPTATVTATTEPAGGAPETTPGSGTAIEVTDSSGTVVTLEGAAQRIVSHSPAATEVLFAIGAGAQVVAVDEFATYPPETEALPRVAYSSPDPELDLSFEPDLVIFAGNQEESLDHFRQLGLPVFFLREPVDLEGVFANIRTFGELAGHEDGAQALIADMQTRLDDVAATLDDVEEGPRVFYELTEDLYTVSPDSFIGAALEFVRARNIAEGVAGAFPQLSSEAIVEANPDVILMADADFVDPATVPQRAGWSGITAVVEDRIYPVDGDVMSRPGPRIVDGIEELARLLYRDRFE